ncbi:LacI family transcriptional regulator [Polaromonas sp. P1(28)-13]|nr:LacI family transcriptional regulator [Polaromonas sp. P1(28)-13]
MKTSATAQEVGRLAQVSQSAVSRTFTPGASVSEETRNKVLAAAKTLGYRPNALARSLITQRSHIIALVMSYLENQFYPLVIEKLSQKLQKQGYHVLMFISDLHEADGVLTEILQYQVDGIVMASTMLSSDLAKSCADSGRAGRFVQPYTGHERTRSVQHEFGDLGQLPRGPHGGRATA